MWVDDHRNAQADSCTDIMMISKEEEEKQEKRRQSEEMEDILEQIRLSENREDAGDFQPMEGSSKQHVEDSLPQEETSVVEGLSKREGKKSEYAPATTHSEAREAGSSDPPTYSQVADDIDQSFEAQMEEAIKASLKEA